MAPEVLRNEPSDEKYVIFLLASNKTFQTSFYSELWKLKDRYVDYGCNIQVWHIQFWSHIVGACNWEDPLGKSQFNAGTNFFKWYLRTYFQCKKAASLLCLFFAKCWQLHIWPFSELVGHWCCWFHEPTSWNPKGRGSTMDFNYWKLLAQVRSLSFIYSFLDR